MKRNKKVNDGLLALQIGSWKNEIKVLDKKIRKLEDKKKEFYYKISQALNIEIL